MDSTMNALRRVEYVPLSEANLGNALGILNRNLPYDNDTTLELLRYKTLEDPDFNPGLTWVATVDGAPHGVMVGVCRPAESAPLATVKFFAVDPACRDRGIASEMLSRIESAARSAGAKTMNIGFSRPNYLMPGLDPRYTVGAAFLLRRGYQRAGEAFNMDVNLADSDWSTDDIQARLAAEGIICRRLASTEREVFGQWMTVAVYSPGWRYQALRAAEMDPPAVFVAEKDDKFVAFACFDGVRPGWFGPMGTKESVRGSGIGSAILIQCLQDMKARGYGVCTINSVGPLYFYSKVAHAVVSRIFWHLEKRLVK
jgi:mycothiol synthase